MGRSAAGKNLSKPMLSETISLVRRRPLCSIVIVVVTLLQMSSALQADSFVMTSGEIIDGTVADGSDISVFIKDKDGLLKSVMVADIAEVQVNLRNGAQVVGRLAGFRDDAYVIVTGGHTLYVEDGRVVQSVVVHNDEAPAAVPNASGPAIGIDEQDPSSKLDADIDSELLMRAPL